MNIDGVKNGIVLDHIKAGKSMMVYELLGLDKVDNCVGYSECFQLQIRKERHH